MRKVERLRFIENRFGNQFVLPYVECHRKQELAAAIEGFESDGVTWGLRTDVKDGTAQGFGLPFILDGTFDGAMKLFRQYGDRLTYIVSHNILDYHCNGVAVPHDKDHVFFEINPFDNNSQRRMYDHSENLRVLFVGESRRVLNQDRFYPGFKPEDSYARDLRLSDIYNLIVGSNDVDEVTFSVRNPDKKIVIW